MRFSSSLLTLSFLSATALANPPNVVGAPYLRARAADNGDTSTVNVTTFGNPTCSAPGGGPFTATYGSNTAALVVSYQLSRDLEANEQLDFSGFAPGEGSLAGLPTTCSEFLETTSPDSNGHPLLASPVCYTLTNGATAQCFKLWHY